MLMGTTTTTTTPKLAFRPDPVSPCTLQHRALWKCLFKKFATMSNQAEVYREDLPTPIGRLWGRVTVHEYTPGHSIRWDNLALLVEAIRR
jgi:hypothetical protein